MLPLLALALALPAPAQDVSYERFVLQNGLTVVLHEDHSLPQVVVDIWYGVGAKDEAPGRSGFAHLFEHLMFRGTARVPDGEFDQRMEAGGGHNNASTDHDRTNYYGEGPAELLPLLLWLDADRMQGLAITQDKLDTEREVVRNERRQNYEDRPYGAADLVEGSLCWPPEHPYHRTVIGSHADLEAATLADVEDFFGTYYVPNNASLVVAGDFDPAETRALVERLFGAVARGDDVQRPAVPIVGPMVGRSIHTVVDRVPYARTTMLWRSPAYLADGDAELDLFSTLLSDGITSRLHQALVVREGLVHEVDASQDGGQLGSLFRVTAVAREGVLLEDVERVIDAELAAYLEEGVQDADLRRAQLRFETAKLRRLQSLRAKADMMNLYQFHWGEPNGFQADLDRYRNATAAGVRDRAAAVLAGGSVVLRVVPEEAPATEDPLAEAPALGAPSAFAPQVPERFTLSNGIAVELWTRPELPLVELLLTLPVGSVQDPVGREGTALLVGEMLDEGAGDRDARAYAAALEALGARFSAAVGREATGVSFSTLSRTLDEGLALYADALQRPRFLETEFERVRREEVADRRMQLESPRGASTVLGAAHTFGHQHPYGRPTGGTPQSLESIDVNDLVQYFSDAYGPTDARLFVAGDVDRARLEPALERALGSWHGLMSPSGRHARGPVGPPQPEGPSFALVDRPGSSQTLVLATLPAVPHDSDVRVGHELLATILGGTFTSRLNQNLRIDKGITYGASARLRVEPSASTTAVQTSVQSRHTATALREIRGELERLAAGGISEEEAGKARAARRLEVIQAFAGLSGLVRTASGLAELGQPIESLGTELAGLDAWSATALDAEAPRFADLAHVRWVLVGDGATLEAALGELGIDDYGWYAADGAQVERAAAGGH